MHVGEWWPQGLSVGFPFIWWYPNNRRNSRYVTWWPIPKVWETMPLTPHSFPRVSFIHGVLKLSPPFKLRHNYFCCSICSCIGSQLSPSLALLIPEEDDQVGRVACHFRSFTIYTRRNCMAPLRTKIILSSRFFYWIEGRLAMGGIYWARSPVSINCHMPGYKYFLKTRRNVEETRNRGPHSRILLFLSSLIPYFPLTGMHTPTTTKTNPYYNWL